MAKRFASVMFLTCLVMMGGLTACLQDTPCRYKMQVTVYAENYYKEVEPVSLYIFREDGTFCEKQVASLDPETHVATFALNHLPDGNYQLVAWGNCKGESGIPDLTEGAAIENQSVCLRPEDEVNYCTPEELFYGSKKVVRQNAEVHTDEIKISRCISGILVKVTGAAQTPESEEEYCVTVEGTMYSIPFLNQLTEGIIYPEDNAKNVIYCLPFHWDNKLLSTGVRYIFPSGVSQTIKICLLRNDKLIKEYPLKVGAVVNKIIEVNLDVRTSGDWFQVNEWSSIGQDEEV